MMRVDEKNNLVIIANNSREAFIAARASEKAIAIEKATAIAAERGIEDRIAQAHAYFLERKIVEERQADYSKGKTEQQRVDEFLHKCSMCK